MIIKNIDIMDLVGYQPMNNPKTDDTVVMYYLCSNVCDSPEMSIEVRKFVVANGEGSISPRDLLLILEPQNDTVLMELFKLSDTKLKQETINMSFRSRRGIESTLDFDGIGKFVAWSNPIQQIDRPIFSYIDRNGLTRFVASPIFKDLVVRVC